MEASFRKFLRTALAHPSLMAAILVYALASAAAVSHTRSAARNLPFFVLGLGMARMDDGAG